MLGQKIVGNLIYVDKDKAYKGQLTPPDSDKKIDATLKLQGKDNLKISAKFFFLTKSFLWVRKR